MSGRTRSATRLSQPPARLSPPDPRYLRQQELAKIIQDLVRKILEEKEISKAANDEQNNIERTLTSTNLQDGLTAEAIESLKRQYRKANAKQREVVDGITRLQTELRTRAAELNYILTQERTRNRAQGKKKKSALSRKKGKKRYS
jgi:hypothetical protein